MKRALALSTIVAPIVLIALTFLLAFSARAQGLGPVMGTDGRAHAQVIAGPDGRLFPVIPTYCEHGWGPCPVPIGPPLPWGYAPPPPLAYAPPIEPLPPQPLGWIWGRYAPCADPDCRTLVVRVVVDGLNVRTVPEGPVIGALANGVPVIPLTKSGPWVLVAPACPLSPTFTASVTAGGVPLSVCGL